MGGHVVVTGAGGFVGQEVCTTLLRTGFSVRALARRHFALPAAQTPDFTLTVVEDLATADHLEDLLGGADAVVHLAARVHRTSERPTVAAAQA